MLPAVSLGPTSRLLEERQQPDPQRARRDLAPARAQGLRGSPPRVAITVVMARALISFVGAGPGDPELITLKALRRLREADAVIHDRLIPREVLGEVRVGAEIIDVGKTPGRPCAGQGHINWLIV